ncbi:MAG: archaellin/type IV pilin N-terminal domain-containing protein [Candidatus Diapherotrites archaeon]
MKTKKELFFKIKFKKGVSVIIGYVILVSFVIVLGIIVYSWMKTYVPRAELECPDGISLFIEDYKCSSEQLNLTLRNIGTFSIGGYFIRATTSPEQEIAKLDLSRNITKETAKLYPIGIRFGEITSTGNSLGPDENEIDIYNLTGGDRIYSLEIIPVRWQEENNKRRLVSCKDAKIKETIECY